MGDALWLISFAAGTFILRLAFAMHVGGLVRSKNSAGVILRTAADLVLAILIFWLIGYAFFDSGPHRLINWHDLAFTPPNIDLVIDQGGSFLFLLAITLIASNIVVGVVAERSRFWPVCAASIIIAGFVTPITGSWLITGWLGMLDVRDFAMAGPIHLVGAAVAVVLAAMVGPRAGKYNRDGSSNAIPGHNLPLASLGVLLTFIGWLPYVLGFLLFRRATPGMGTPTAAAGIVANVLLAAAAGGGAAMLLSHIRYRKPDIHLTYIGLLGALVSISAAADVSSTWMALVIGIVAGLIIPVATLTIDLLLRIDDPAGGIAIHGIGAVWGLLAAALFAPGLTFGQRSKAVGFQIVAIFIILIVAILAAGIVFYVMSLFIPLRSKEADEFDGLDLAEHDLNAYPDFQQTMIKSYHLREA